MLIIGIDPGTINTGFGIIKFENNRFSHVSSGVITPNPKFSLELKLQTIYNGLINAIDTYKPDQFALETAFYGKNVQSVLKIGYVRGIALLAAANRNLSPGEYSPREVKKAVVGKGAASKEQVQFMVSKLLSKELTNLKLDETDALAVAVCHAIKGNSPGSKSSSWKKFIKDNPDRIKQ